MFKLFSFFLFILSLFGNTVMKKAASVHLNTKLIRSNYRCIHLHFQSETPNEIENNLFLYY